MAPPLTQGTTFGGRPIYIPGPNYFRMVLGVAPSSGVVCMTQKAVAGLQASNTGFTLRLVDGRNRIEIEDLYIREVEHQSPVAEGDAMVHVHIEDARSLWRYPSITGFFNVLKEDGKTYLKNSINGTKPFTFDELVQKCLDVLPGVTLDAATGVEWIPQNVEWEGVSALTALHALLKEVARDICIQPDGSAEIIDLTDDEGFEPPDGRTIVAQTSEEIDTAHQRPKTIRVMFRTLREESTKAWEPVLQHIDSTEGTAKKGEWDTVDNVLQTWGSSEKNIRNAFYGAERQSKWREQALVNSLSKGGGADLGAVRLQHIKAKLYRVWRLTDTDRDKKLPLARLRATTGGKTGRENALPAIVEEADGHQKRRQSGFGFYVNISRKNPPPYATRIVDAKEGIVEILADRPLCRIDDPTPENHADQDYVLRAPTSPQILIAYHRKFETNPEAAYKIVEADLVGDNNGQTLTRLNERLVLREVSDGMGGFTAQNETEVQEAADDYLEAWSEKFELPDPELVRMEGVDPAVVLTSAARAITFQFDGKVETLYRINSDRSPDRYGLGPSAKTQARAFALKAEIASVVVPDAVGGRGGTGHAIGILGGTAPPIRDFVEARESVIGHDDHAHTWLNDEEVGLAVAMDLRCGPSGKKCCEGPKGPVLTRRGRSIPKPGGGVVLSGHGNNAPVVGNGVANGVTGDG